MNAPELIEPEDPRMAEAFKAIGRALTLSGRPDRSTAWIDAQNVIQDLIDERRDQERGPGVV